MRELGVPVEESRGNVVAHVTHFQLFERLHEHGDYPGTGAGLAIVGKAVDRMRGRVGLESAAGQGTNFWIELSRGDS